MRAVTTFLSLPLACGDDVRLGNPAVDVDVVIDGAGCADMAAADHLRRKCKDSPTVRANRVLDLAEQEGLQRRQHVELLQNLCARLKGSGRTHGRVPKTKGKQ